MTAMNKKDRLIEVADLDPVAYFGEAFVLYIDGEDENIPSSLCVQANFDTLQFDPVQPMGVFLKSKPYLPLIDVDARISQRQRLLDEIKPDEIAAMLRDFNQKKRFIQQNIIPLSELFPGWQPGG
jgi:hypothetical protein